MKNNKSKIFISVLFLLVTFCLITGGMYMIAKNIKEKDKYEKVSATITSIDKVYNSVTGEDERVIYVSYEVEGVIYSDVKLNWQSNFMFKGEVITISYLKDNPNIIKSEKENYTAGVILLVMGIIFLGCSGYMIYEIIKKKI